MIVPSPTSLDPATRDEMPVLANLLELYIHDLSETFPVVPDATGRFGYERLPLYWQEPGRRFPFLIRFDGELAGFVLATRGSPATDDPEDLDVAEFFVMRRHRRAGVGRDAAFALWDELPGRWIVRVSEGNLRARPFWERVVDEYTRGDFQRWIRPGTPHPWIVYALRSRAR